MAEIGWIKLHRKIQDCFIWNDKPYDKARAWIDLLLSAMHRDKKLLIDGNVVIIERGSFMTSRLKLADRWGWSIKKVDAYLNMLESEKMVTTVRTPKGTTLTIVNYDDYQVLGTTEDIAEDTTEDTPKEITEDTPKGTTEVTTEDTQNKNIKNNKNVNNDKNVKNEKNNINPPISPLGEEEVEKPKRTRFVPPTYEEVDAYCVERNNNVDAQAFIDFYESKGWMVGKNKMKDWKASIRTWERSRQGNVTSKAINKSKRQGIDWK